MTYDDYIRATNLRDALCSNLRDTVSVQDITRDVVLKRSILVSSILQDTSQVSINGLENCTMALVKTITTDPALAGFEDIYSDVYGALSGLITAVTSSQFAEYTEKISELLQLIDQGMNALSAGVLSSLAIDENALEITLDSVKVSLSVVNTKAQENTLYVPQSAYDAYNNEEVSKVIVAPSGSADGLGVSLWQSSLTGSQLTTIASNSIGIRTSDYVLSSSSNGRRRLVESSGSEAIPQPLHGTIGSNSLMKLATSNSHEVKMIFYNHEPKSYSFINSTTGSILCKKSTTLEAYQVNANCTTDSNLLLTCPGNETATLTYTCPSKDVYPTCSKSTDGGSVFEETSSCKVIAYTEANTTCLCQLAIQATARRLSNQLKSTADSEQASYASTATVVISDFIQRWKSADNLSLTTIKKNLVITMTMVTIVAVTFAGILTFAFMDLSEVSLYSLITELGTGQCCKDEHLSCIRDLS